MKKLTKKERQNKIIKECLSLTIKHSKSKEYLRPDRVPHVF
jgi:hypothetical protein